MKDRPLKRLRPGDRQIQSEEFNRAFDQLEDVARAVTAEGSYETTDLETDKQMVEQWPIWIVLGDGNTDSHGGTVNNSPTGGSGTWTFLPAGLPTPPNVSWIGYTVTFTSGTQNGRTGLVTAWDGTNLTIFNAILGAPANGDTFTIANPSVLGGPYAWTQVLRAQPGPMAPLSGSQRSALSGTVQEGSFLAGPQASDVTYAPAFERNGNPAPIGTIALAWWDQTFGGVVFDWESASTPNAFSQIGPPFSTTFSDVTLPAGITDLVFQTTGGGSVESITGAVVGQRLRVWNHDSSNGKIRFYDKNDPGVNVVNANLSLGMDYSQGSFSIPITYIDVPQGHFLELACKQTGGWIGCMPLPQPTALGGSTITSVSSTLTAEDKSLVGTIVGSFTAPAGFLWNVDFAGSIYFGYTVKMRAHGVITTGATAGTIEFYLKFGATIVATTGAIAPTVNQTNRYWEMEADFIFRSATTVFVQGRFSYMNAATPASMIDWPMRGGSADPPVVVTVQNVETTAGLFDFHSSTSNALHTITCNMVQLELAHYLGR